MFSASLLSMMIHSLPPPARRVFFGIPDDPVFPLSPSVEEVWVSEGRVVPSSQNIAKQLKLALHAWSKEWPRIPLVGGADPEHLSSLVKVASDFIETNRGSLWGRVPLDILIRRYLVTQATSVEQEHLDLGTPVWADSGSAGSSSTCGTLLAQTPIPGSAVVGAAIVDLGEVPPAGASGTPRDFGGKLRHVIYPPGTSVDLSAHAEQVLEVLLERLKTENMLAKTTVSMSLVVNPTPDTVRAGLNCFTQHCAPEMLTAVKAIDAHLSSDKLPAVVNMSLGTHVGPHDGQSPLEKYISGTLFRPSERFLFAAAGNEGSRGISARLDLKTNQADYMELAVNGQCAELLVEFWWDDSIPADVEITALIEGSGFSPSRVAIQPGLAGAALVPAPMGHRPPMNFLTLLHAKSSGTMSCIAFAATRPPPASGKALPELRISFDLMAKSADVMVQAWVVICEKQRQTAFVQGSKEATVAAPASDPKVVSVAGFDQARGQMWRHSSRGPASQYSKATQTKSPAMAHLAHYRGSRGASHGTSYASPRAAADATKPLADPKKRTACTDVKKLIQETYPSVAPVAPVWDPRFGFHKQIT